MSSAVPAFKLILQAREIMADAEGKWLPWTARAFCSTSIPFRIQLQLQLYVQIYLPVPLQFIYPLDLIGQVTNATRLQADKIPEALEGFSLDGLPHSFEELKLALQNTGAVAVDLYNEAKDTVFLLVEEKAKKQKKTAENKKLALSFGSKMEFQKLRSSKALEVVWRVRRLL